MKGAMNWILVAILVIAVASIVTGAEMITCYQCEQVDVPVGSDCWNASDTLQTVECEYQCFTSMFQSGGNHLDNYWNVKRGCEQNCDGSLNCNSQHYGACKYCCKGDLCNDVVGSSAVDMRISLSLVFICILGLLTWL